MRLKYRLVSITLIIVGLVMISAFFIDKTRITIASDQPTKDVSQGVENTQEVVVKFYYDSQEQLNAVAGELDIWEIHPSAENSTSSGYALAAVYPAQQDWLEVLGYKVEVDQEHTDLLQAPNAALDPRFYYFDNNNPNPNGLYMVDFIQDTNVAYPELTELFDIGNAWATSPGGTPRDMWVMRITNEDLAYGDIVDKPPFFLFANIHAREVTTPEMAIRYIKYLTTGYNGEGGYGTDPDVTWLVNHHVVYVMVSQNPDGHVVNEEVVTYPGWRKNVDNDDGCSSSYGVDLNRNHSFFWGCCGGSSGNACGETYRGPQPDSEPETAAFQTFAAQVLTDFNGDNGDNEYPPAAPDNTAGMFISLHSYQNEILWSYEHSVSGGGAPNAAQLETIGRKLGAINTFYPSGFLYTVDGGTIDWIYGHFGIPGYTFEIGPLSGVCGNFFPAYECMDGLSGYPENFWGEVGPSFIYANKIARTPYVTSYGPDTENVVTTPAEVPAGIPVVLNATISDHRFGGDPLKPIVDAEYFIDIEGIDSTGIAMSPGDGDWGGTSEAVEAVIDTTSLSLGQHYVLVHGKSNEGDWGPFTAVFLTIIEPQAPLASFTTDSPVQMGQPMHFLNQTIGWEPITYAWDFGDGVGSSTEISPTYTYTDLGTYTVTLTAINEYGDGLASNSVFVIPHGIDSIVLSQVTSNPVFPGDLIEFTANLLPDDAGKPFSYDIDFGDGTSTSGSSSDDPLSFTHIFNTNGIYTMAIQVQNGSMMIPAVDSIDVSLGYRVFLPLALSR